MIEILIPGEPCALGRGRVSAFRDREGRTRARVYTPRKSAEWKAEARWVMRTALPQPLDGPLALWVDALFPCPRGDWRKRKPRAERWHAKAPDADNVLKLICDAGNGVLWHDDRQVARAVVAKRIAAQGAAPMVRLRVDRLEVAA